MSEKRERDYKDPMRGLHPATAVIIAGYRSRLSEGAVTPPVFRTSTFEFPSAEEGAQFFQRAYHLKGDDGQPAGLVYTRLNNPNIEIIEDKMVAAEHGAVFAAGFPSGMSAITTTLLALLPSGARILYGTPVYGGTYFFFKHLGPERFGLQAVPIDMSDLAKVEETLRSSGPFQMVFVETPANPTMTLTDIAEVCRLSRQYCGEKVLMAVDNTFMGPVFQKPFKCGDGVDLVIYSATKFIGGHSDLIAGFTLTKSQPHIEAIKDFRSILGATVSPDTAWLMTRSMSTLWMRMERQAETALKVAQALAVHPAVSQVFFPGLLLPRDGAAYEVYKKQCSGPGSLISFNLKEGTRAAVFKVLNAVEICHLAVSLGGTESLIEHPRSMTHSDMTAEDLDACGIGEGMIRLSVGLEHSLDIINDLDNALKALKEVA